MEKREERFYEFGPFRVNTEERLLRRGDEVLPLTPKAIDTLLALISSPGHMLEKERLMKAVWPDTFVEEGALVRNISILRKALGEGTDDAQYIDTIPKRGYRFIAPVREVSAVAATPVASPETPSQSPSHRNRSIAAAALAIIVIIALVAVWLAMKSTAGVSVRSLAVLPFKSLSNDPAQDYLSEGITEALVTSLARIGTLRVISLASVTASPNEKKSPAEVAREWNADAVLRGTVQRATNRVRIHAELVDAKTGTVYWSDNYERDTGDTLVLQSEVAGAIAREIRVKLTPQEAQFLARTRKVDPEALNAYLKGRYFWNRRTPEKLQSAVRSFQQAIDIEPAYALAYAGLADSYALLGSTGSDGMTGAQALPLAKAAATRALQMDDTLAEAHASMAYIHMSFEWNLPKAAKEFERAIALNPGYATAHHWNAHYFLAAGSPGRALAEMKRAHDLEPLSVVINVGIGWCLYYSRQYDQAIAQYKSALELDPYFPLGHQMLGMAYQQNKMHQEAVEEFQKAVEYSDHSAGAISALASAYADAGRKQDAERELARLTQMASRQYVPAIFFANAYRAVGNQRQMFESILKAIEDRSDYLVYVRSDPGLVSLAKDPNFIKLLPRLQPLN